MKKIFSFFASAMLSMCLFAETYSVTYNLTGCEVDGDTPTTITDDDDQLSIDLIALDGFTDAGATITVTMGGEALTTDYMEDNYYMFMSGNVFIYCYDGFAGDVVITAEYSEAGAGPVVPETFSAATFEEFTIAENSVYRPSTLQFGDNWLTSGGVVFSSRKEDWGGYSGIQVVNYANGTATGTDVYLPAATAAAEGENYATVNIMGLFSQVQFATTTLSGLLINNTAFNVNSFQHGDGYARPLAQGDWFKVTFTGLKDGVVTNSFDYYLADYRTAGAWTYVSDWTWVDLSSLGEINALQFALDGTDKGDWGLNTSSYFCIDNIGGSPTPTGCQTVTNVLEAEKLLINGQVVIRREGKLYNVAGQAIR